MSDTTSTRWNNKEMKRTRLEEEPSGWVYLTQNRDAQLVIDALLDGAPESFNKTELSEYAGVSRKTTAKHLETLVELGVAKQSSVSDTRYRLNEETPVTEAILQVDAAVSRARDRPTKQRSDTS